VLAHSSSRRSEGLTDGPTFADPCWDSLSRGVLLAFVTLVLLVVSILGADIYPPDRVGAGLSQHGMTVRSDQVASEQIDRLGAAAEDALLVSNARHPD